MRAVVALACATGIPVSAWLAEDERTLLTAMEVVGEQQDGGGRVIESG